MSAERTLHSAAARLVAPLPKFLRPEPRVVPGDSESPDCIAICEQHPEGEYDLDVPWADVACDNCGIFEMHHERFANLIVGLLRARAPLAEFLKSWEGFEVPESAPYSDDWKHAVSIARAIVGGES